MIKESVAYSIGEFLFKGSRFLMIPFYVTFLPQEEYGILQQIIILTSFSDVFVSLAVKQAMLRLYYDYKSELEQLTFLGTILSMLSGSYLIVWAIFTFTPMFTWIFDFPELSSDFQLILLYSFLFELLHLSMNYFRIHRRLKSYMQISALVSFSEIGLILFMLLLNSNDAMVRIYGGTIACSIGLVWILISEKKLRIRPEWNWNIIRSYLKFSYPLISVGILGWFLVSYDKMIIDNQFGTANLAIYGLAFQLASVYKFSQAGFLRAVSVNVYEKYDTAQFRKHAKRIGVVSAIIYASVGFCFLVLMYYVAPLFMPTHYAAATDLTMLLIISKILLLYYMYNTTILKSHKDTLSVLSIYILSSILFFFACRILIPGYGLLGGVYANILSSFFMFSVGQIVVHFKYDFKLTGWEWIILGAIILYAVFARVLAATTFHAVTAAYTLVLVYLIWKKRELTPWKK